MEYKILLIKNRYTGTINIKKYLDWFKLNTPIEIVMDEITTDFDVTTFKAQNATYSGVVCGKEIIPKLRTVVPEGKYNAVVFLYGNPLDGIRVSSTNIMGQDPLYADTELVQTFQGNDGGRTINHELFHAFFLKAHKLQINITDNMDTYLRDSDLTVDNVIDTNREIALQNLKPYWTQICAFRNVTHVTSQTTQPYKYFKASEVVGLKPELVKMLDIARGIANTPFKITSGYRTPEHNLEVGGVPNSAHTKGLAVDIACTTQTRQAILKGLLTCGIPIFIEDCPVHIHVDIDSSIHSMGWGIVSQNG